MTAQECIENFKTLPDSERQIVALYVLRMDKPWIPESFRQGMLEADLGCLVDMDDSLNQPPP